MSRFIHPYETFRDTPGQVRAGGFVSFFTNTTATLTTIYSDIDLTATQSNPYELDDYGRVVGDIFFQGLVTIQETNADGSDVVTTDNVSSGLVPYGNGINAQAGDYSLVASDNGKTIVGNHATAQTFTLLAAATAGDKWKCTLHAGSTGAISISGTVGGLTDAVVYPGQSMIIVCNGTIYEATTTQVNIGNGINTQSGNYTILLSDNGKTIVGTHAASMTVTLPDPGTDVPDKFTVTIHAGSVTGVILIVGVVGGISSPTIKSGETYVITTNRTIWEGFFFPAYARVVSNYVNGRSNYVGDDTGVDPTAFDVDAVIAASWESVGPTGSSATNIWTGMDSIPSNLTTAAFVKLRIFNSIEGSTDNQEYYQIVYARITGSSTAAGGLTQVSKTREYNRAGAAEAVADENMAFPSVPLDSSLRFDLYRAVNGTSPTVSVLAYMEGWVQE